MPAFSTGARGDLVASSRVDRLVTNLVTGCGLKGDPLLHFIYY